MAGPRMRALTPEEEIAFRRDMSTRPEYTAWRDQFAARFGEQPNIGPGGDYDYRAAWLNGVTPQPYAHDAGAYHWPSSVSVPPYTQSLPLKSADHPSAWMEDYMRRFGTDPHDAANAFARRGLF